MTRLRIVGAAAAAAALSLAAVGCTAEGRVGEDGMQLDVENDGGDGGEGGEGEGG
ncbi:MAG TPA: hypothetical protein VM307_06860 [Egibacteraceae bacterium]|nr:hypothetical protein [Egibacteraceae bacterium]